MEVQPIKSVKGGLLTVRGPEGVSPTQNPGHVEIHCPGHVVIQDQSLPPCPCYSGPVLCQETPGPDTTHVAYLNASGDQN